MTSIWPLSFGKTEWVESIPEPVFPKWHQRNNIVLNRCFLKRWFAGQVHLEKPTIYSLLLKIHNMC